MAVPFCADVKANDLDEAFEFASKGDLQQEAVESDAIGDFAKIMRATRDLKGEPKNTSGKINLDPEKVKNGLGQLVLTLVRLLHELLERQAIRRMEAGSLTDSEIENIGVTLMKQAEEIERLRKEFSLEEKDLNLDLGPLGKLL
ncbi:MAG: gas vesicle protein K [Desulfomonilaceae bacterium]